MVSTAGYLPCVEPGPQTLPGKEGLAPREVVGKFHFLSLGSLTDGLLSLQICPGTGGLSRVLPEQPGKPAPGGVAQMASPNDKVNSNMSWRHCQPAAYLSCHSSLVDQGRPPPCPIPSLCEDYLQETDFCRLGGGHSDRALPE